MNHIKRAPEEKVTNSNKLKKEKNALVMSIATTEWTVCSVGNSSAVVESSHSFSCK